MKKLLIGLMGLMGLMLPCGAQTKISALPSASPVSSTDIIPDVQGYTGTGTGTTTGVTAAQLKTFMNASLSFSNLSGSATIGQLPVGTSSTTVAAGNDSRITGALQAANNLSDVGSAATARANLHAGFTFGTLTVYASGNTNLSSTGTNNTEVVTAGAGTGSYVATISLADAGAVTGDEFRANVSLPSSANPVVKFYDNSTGGTLLATVAGNSSATGLVNETFVFNGTGWIALTSSGLQSANNLSDVGSASAARMNLGLNPMASETLGTGVAAAAAVQVETPGGLAVSMPGPLSSALAGKHIDVLWSDDVVGDEDFMQAASVLASLEENGECRIVGVGCDVKDQYGAPALSGTFRYFGGARTLPIGSYNGSTTYTGISGDSNGLTLATNLPNAIAGNNGLTNPQMTFTQLARKVFAAEVAAGNVNTLEIPCTGSPSAIYDFYNSAAYNGGGAGGDAIPYTGAQLVAMVQPYFWRGGGGSTSGTGDYNMGLDTTASAIWNTLQTVLPAGHINGVPFLGGSPNWGVGFVPSAAVCPGMPTGSPAKLIGPTVATLSSFPIYDPIVILLAVRGPSWGGTTYFSGTAGTDVVSGSNNTFTSGAGTFTMWAYGGGGSAAVDPIIQAMVSQANLRPSGFSANQQINLSTGSQTVPLTLTSSGTTALEFISTSGSSYDSIYAQIGQSGLNIYDGTAGSTPLGAKGGAQNQVTTSSDGVFGWLNSATYQYGSLDTALARAAAGSIKVTNGSSGLGSFLASSVSADAVGYGLQVKEGTGGLLGHVTLSSGTASVTIANLASTDEITVSEKTGSNSGTLTWAISGTTLTITSSNALDANVATYNDIKPAP